FISPLLQSTLFPSTTLFRSQGASKSDGTDQNAAYFAVTPGFFGTMRIPILEGRDFNDRDNHDSTPMIVISQRFARQFFPGKSLRSEEHTSELQSHLNLVCRL